MLQVSLGDSSSSALITIPDNEEFKYVVDANAHLTRPTIRTDQGAHRPFGVFMVF